VSLSKALAHFFDSDIRQRGLDYFRGNRVNIKSGGASKATAHVAGTDDYTVQLERRVDTVSASCTCPYYADRMSPCKHLWATLLAVEARGLLGSAYTNKRLQLDLLDEDQYDANDDSYLDDEDEFEDEEILPLPGSRSAAGSTLMRLLANVGLGGRSAARVKAPPPKPKPKPQPKNQPPQWLPVLQGLQHSFRAQRKAPTHRVGELHWILNHRESIVHGNLVVDSYVREKKKNGEWGKPKSLRLAADNLDWLSPEDQHIATILLGASGENNYGYGYSYGRQYGAPGASRWVLVPATTAMVLPEMARTGRCYRTEDSSNFVKLSLDDGPPWEFRLALELDPAGEVYRLQGRLHRNGEQRPIKNISFVSLGGVLVADAVVSRYTRKETGPWVPLLRDGRIPPVLVKDAPRFLAELLKLPDLPSLDLPEALRYEERQLSPRPQLRVSTPKNHWNKQILHAELSFNYHGELVPEHTVQDGIYLPDKKLLIRRDRGTEDMARGRLGQFSLRRSAYARPEEPYELKTKMLPRLVQELTAEGWHIEAEGKLYRQPGAIKIEVTSGIDWFELHGSVDFGEQTASLPALLAALKRRENSVQLDDGTFGILPEEWLKKYGALAGLGKQQEDHLRFTAVQVGVLDALLAAQPDATCDAVFSQARDRLRRFEGIKPSQPPATFQGELRPYQTDGLGWLHFLRDFSFGGCLADDMGLGKTVQVLALLEARRKLRAASNNGDRPAPSLVVVPRSLIFNWKAEAKRFTPQLRVLDHTGMERVKGHEHFDDYDLILTTYGTLRRDALHFKDVTFDYAILDEAQAIKNASTESAKAARLLKARHRLVMSGTPVENHLGELWSLFEFLNPGMLGAASVFQLTGAGSKNADPEMRALLARALRPFILRRTKDQVAKDLPQKTEQTLYCELDSAQRKQYDELKEHFRKSLLGKIDAQGLNKSKIMVLEALLRLRQAACHPGLLDKKQAKDSSAKLDALLAQLREVCDEGHKALVFSQFTSFLAILKDRLKKENFTFEYLDGQTTNRQACVERFQNDPDCPLFLISLKAGGLGLNLTAAEYVFLLDPWWNPAVEAQAIDRTHRIGQTKPVFAYRLIAKDTVEEKVLELQKTKRDLADAIINEDNSLIRNLDREDLELLLS
jgi:hypothetical protein